MTLFPRLQKPRTVAQRLALDIHRGLEALEHDRSFALGTFAAWRSKEPLLEALATTWHELPAAELLALTPRQLTTTDAYFREHGRFALWVRSTEAMPATLETRYDAALALLIPLGRAAVDTLGGVPEDTPPPPPDRWGSLRR